MLNQESIRLYDEALATVEHYRRGGPAPSAEHLVFLLDYMKHKEELCVQLSMDLIHRGQEISALKAVLEDKIKLEEVERRTITRQFSTKRLRKLIGFQSES